MPRMAFSARFRDWLGVSTFRFSHTERWVSALGAFCGLGLVWLVSAAFLPAAPASWLVASMGASAVLLFAVPHGALSQPWPVFGGHLVSALVGVGCAAWLGEGWLAAAAAVALAVAVMHYLRCIHPPGGATALTAVIGGPAVHELGFGFVVQPVLANVLVMLAVAVGFNYLFAWRRYPAALARRAAPAVEPADAAAYAPVAHEDFVYALSEIDSFVDITEDDLLTIYRLATRPHVSTTVPVPEIHADRCYSNGRYGVQWSVRQVTAIESDDGQPASIAYRVLAGVGRRSRGVASFEEFRRWARYEVYRDEENWRRVGGRDDTADAV